MTICRIQSQQSVMLLTPLSSKLHHTIWPRPFYQANTSLKFVSRIPVRTTSVKKSNLSKSTSFLRSSQSRIPVTLKLLYPRDSVQPLSVFSHELECSHSQLNESGFVSDFSVTNSGYSQANIEPKNERSSWDTSDFKNPSQKRHLSLASEMPTFRSR